MASVALESAERWEALAAEQDRLGDWERERGRCDGVHRNRAQTYRRAAEADRIEHRTGVAVCVCCHKAFGRGLNIPGVNAR